MTDDRREWYIYVLRDPRDNEVRYVGWTINIKRRFREHLRKANEGIKSHKNSWINVLAKLYLQPVIEVIERGAGEWQSVEMYWIRHYRMQGARLTNATDGGEGVVGMIVSQETREKISKAGLGRKRSPETKERMRQAQQGRAPSPEAIEKARQARLGRKNSPEHIEKMRQSRLGRKNSPEHIERVRQAMTGRKQSPEAIEKSRQARLGSKHSPGHIEKMRQAMLGKKHSPESRQKMGEAQTRVRGIPVRRVEDGVLFASIKEAARSVDGAAANVHRAIATGLRSAGYHWERVDENTTDGVLRIIVSQETKEKMRQANIGRKRSPESIERMRKAQTRGRGIAVRRVEDGMIFTSIQEAARFVDRGHGSIIYAIRTGGKSAGYHWERVGETPPADLYTLDGNALIMRID